MKYMTRRERLRAVEDPKKKCDICGSIGTVIEDFQGRMAVGECCLQEAVWADSVINKLPVTR